MHMHQKSFYLVLDKNFCMSHQFNEDVNLLMYKKNNILLIKYYFRKSWRFDCFFLHISKKKNNYSYIQYNLNELIESDTLS